MLVTLGSEAGLGFSNFCNENDDTISCAPVQGRLGIQGRAAVFVTDRLAVGLSGATIELPSQPYNMWTAAALVRGQTKDERGQGAWWSAELGVLVVPDLEVRNFGMRSRFGPHVGAAFGQTWNPYADALVGYQFFGAVSFFSDDDKLTNRFETITWIGVAIDIGYIF